VKLQSFGGKDSVKENRQGFLSRSIKQFFKRFSKFEKRYALVKKFFDKRNRAASAALFQSSQEKRLR